MKLLRPVASIVGAAALAASAAGAALAAEAQPTDRSADAPRQASADIVDTAVAAGDFTTLAAALEAAGLVETLKGEGPFTVFAPTDAAFAALPPGTVEGLLADVPALTDVLLYHVVAGDVRAADVVTLDSAETVLGQPVSIRVEGGNVFVNDARVVTTDIVASNGVIHVIDAVLIPAADEPAPAPAPPAAGSGTLADDLAGAGSPLWWGVAAVGAAGVLLVGGRWATSRARTRQ